MMRYDIRLHKATGYVAFGGVGTEGAGGREGDFSGVGKCGGTLGRRGEGGTVGAVESHVEEL
jgi:hypothetical protein